MPKNTHAGVSNAGEIEEAFVRRADDTLQEVNVSTSQDAEPKHEDDGKTEEGSRATRGRRNR